MALDEVLDQIERYCQRRSKCCWICFTFSCGATGKGNNKRLECKGTKPITVYNTNSYDKPEVIDSLDGLIDVYLPDYKYVTPQISAEFSDASDYPEVALKALKRMYFQKGSTLQVDDEGRAENGILIRHLVLPGHAEESKKVLRSIAEELSPGVHLSLMSQYHPTESVKKPPCNKTGALQGGI